MLLPTKILHEAELPSLLKKREKKGELDLLLAPEFVQIPDLDLQFTHIWPQNLDLAVLLAQRSNQRLHRSKLLSLAKTPLFGPRGEGQDRPQHVKLWCLVVVWVANKVASATAGQASERDCLAAV